MNTWLSCPLMGLFRDNEPLRIPTGQMQTSWQFTSMAEDLNAGLPLTNPARGQGGTWIRGLRSQVWRSNHSATLPPQRFRISWHLSFTMLAVTPQYVLTDLTRCPIPMISCPFFLISLTNSMGACPLSKPLENIRAAASKAPPNLSPY